MTSMVKLVKSRKLPTSTHNSKANPAELYLSTINNSESRRVIESILNTFAELLGVRHWMNIAWSEFDLSWLELVKTTMMGNGRTADTINAILSMLKGVALHAWKLSLIDDRRYILIFQTKGIPTSSVSKLRSPNSQEIKILFDQCLVDRRLQGLRDAAIIALISACGLSRSEVVKIGFYDVSFAERSIRIFGRNGKERIIFPPPRVWKIIMEWIIGGRGNDEGALFCRIRKNAMVLPKSYLTSQTVYLIVQQLLLLTGVQKFSPKDLRKSFVSYLFEQDESIKAIASTVGHSDTRSTLIYDLRPSAIQKMPSREIDL